MPSSTLLPTPLPANRPRRWPRPTVSSALIARTPTSSAVAIGVAVDRVERPALQRAQLVRAGSRPSASSGTTGAVDDAAEQVRRRPAGASPGRSRGGGGRAPGAAGDARPEAPAGSPMRAGRQAVDVGDRHQEQPVAGEADDLGLDCADVGLLDQARRSRRASFRPTASITSPATRVSRPRTWMVLIPVAATRHCSRKRASSPPGSHSGSSQSSERPSPASSRRQRVGSVASISHCSVSMRQPPGADHRVGDEAGSGRAWRRRRGSGRRCRGRRG